jgi:response regulator of citrate/malate metabolism
MIVDDDPIVSAHFSDIVRSSPNLEVAGIASSLAAARQQIGCKPHLTLLDVGLPDGSGLTIIPELKASHATLVLMVTTFGDRETVVAALRAGADGYLLKGFECGDDRSGHRGDARWRAPVNPAAAVTFWIPTGA